MMERNRHLLLVPRAWCLVPKGACLVPVCQVVVPGHEALTWVRIGAESRSKSSKDAQQRNAEVMTAVQQKARETIEQESSAGSMSGRPRLAAG